jgi:hypothetical protein
MDLPDAFGRRAATLNSQGPAYDLRIASEVFEDAGGWYVHLVGEDQWWDWRKHPQDAKPRDQPTPSAGPPATSRSKPAGEPNGRQDP